MTKRTVEYMTMNDSKFYEVLTEMGDDYSDESVRDALLGDWPNAKEHQQWLDSAPVAEIVDWLQSFLATREEETEFNDE